MVISDKVCQALNKYDGAWTVALDITKVFDRIWYSGLLHKMKSYGVSR